jgi:shikimate dehydrogenase
VLHAAAYKHLGLSFDYGKHDIASGSLANFLESRDFGGVSVTMPLKQEAFALAERHDKYAIATGVANTLFQFDGKFSAANTDVYGIAQALASVSPPELTVIIGSGATARSALVARAGMFPETKISLVYRNLESGNELVSFAKFLGFSARMQAAHWEVILDANLVMSLVPAGAFAELWGEISKSGNAKSGMLFDVAYNPWPSIAAAAWDPAHVISGIEMLIWQAIEQVQLFVAAAGVETKIDRDLLYQVMKSAVSAK